MRSNRSFRIRHGQKLKQSRARANAQCCEGSKDDLVPHSDLLFYRYHLQGLTKETKDHPHPETGPPPSLPPPPYEEHQHSPSLTISSSGEGGDETPLLESHERQPSQEDESKAADHPLKRQNRIQRQHSRHSLQKSEFLRVNTQEKLLPPSDQSDHPSHQHLSHTHHDQHHHHDVGLNSLYPLAPNACRKSRDIYADLVLVFKYMEPSKQSAPKPEMEQETMRAYEDVLSKLSSVGLQYETRPSGKETILVFILCPWSVLKREVIRNSIHDWLTGVKVADTLETEQLLQPAKSRDHSLDTLSDADRTRLVWELITSAPNEGGAGIYPSENDYVDSILPLHDKEFNKAWLKSWSTKWFVNQDDFASIRDHFGEKVAYYFEFLEFYFLWLILPTGLGVLVHFFGSSYSIFYSFCVILWSVVYIESWKRREKELAHRWGVKNVTRNESRRPAFKGDKIVRDPLTNELKPFFSPWKRWARKIAGLPVIIGGALVLSLLLTLVFVLEVFLEVYYGGYMKEILVYLPTVLFTLALPYVEEICQDVSRWLTDFENHETHGSYDYHLVQKAFLFKALNSYLSILLTAYVYIPFGPRVIAVLQAIGLPFATVAIQPSMLQDRLQAFMISNQLISFFTETIYPWMSRRVISGAAMIHKEVSQKLHNDASTEKTGTSADSRVAEPVKEPHQDPKQVREFLRQVQEQVDLPEYDVNEDYGEMVEQFGCISLFSLIWPLTGLCAFINNWVELRSDAAKICFHTRRPIPGRTDSIGPWIDNLQYLAWFSSLTNASILYLFHGTMPSKGHGIETSVPTDAGEVTRPEFNSGLGLGMLLLGLIASEHFYFLINWTVRNILESIPSTAELTVRKKDYNVKRSWLKRLNEAVGSTFLNSPNPIITVVGSNGDATTLTTDMGQEGEGEKTRSVMSKTSGYSPVGSMDGVVGWRARLQHDLGAEAIRTVFKSL